MVVLDGLKAPEIVAAVASVRKSRVAVLRLAGDVSRKK
ncbi:hypothetical protein PC116_g33427 [Phytophthora cactorum]|nr:hypothetical protein PC116_g33427 [Phytophthora cactorum]